MGRSRRKYKKSRAKVRVGLPKKKPGIFKPAVAIPANLPTPSGRWDNEGYFLQNYRSFGVVANPNLLGVRARTPHIVQTRDLQVPHDHQRQEEAEGRLPVVDGEPDGQEDLESDDLRAVLGKKRKDGKTAPVRSLTTIQSHYIGKLIEKYGDNHQAMFQDTKLNSMQHSLGTLKKLCQRYHAGVKFYIKSR